MITPDDLLNPNLLRLAARDVELIVRQVIQPRHDTDSDSTPDSDPDQEELR